MKKYLIAILLAAIAWVAPAASAFEGASVTPAVYKPGSGEDQFQLVGRRHKHRHYRHRHRHHRHHRHHHHRHYSRSYYPYYSYGYPYYYYPRRQYSVSVPGLGSFYYRD